MKRTIIWGSVAAAALITLLGVWFMLNFEQVTVDAWESPTSEARRNRFLALERWLGAQHRPVTQIDDAEMLDSLPSRGVLLLSAHRDREFTPARVEALKNWVSHGGYLILQPSWTPHDPLQEALGIQTLKGKKEGDPNEADDEDEPTAQTDTPADVRPNAIPGAAKPPEKPASKATQNVLHIPELGDFNLGVYSETRARHLRSKIPPAWKGVANHPGHGVIHFPLGQGQVTVGISPGWYENWTIGQNDYAELLQALLQRYQPRGPVLVASRLHTPDIFDWLLQNARPALVSAGLLLMLWLWRVMPRFGVIAAPAPAGRRALGEHLAAVGRFLWRQGQLDHCLQVARQHLLNRLGFNHAQILRLPPEAQTQTLAQLSGLSADALYQALYAPATSPQSFTHALRTLRHLEQRLFEEPAP